jgi:hypothetical protein
MAQQAATARATFELENAVAAVDDNDALFRYDAAAQRATEQQRPWRDNPHYFNQCAPARDERRGVRRGVVCAAPGCVCALRAAPSPRTLSASRCCARLASDALAAPRAAQRAHLRAGAGEDDHALPLRRQPGGAAAAAAEPHARPKPLALALSSRLLLLRLTRLLARHTGQVMGMMQGKTMGDTFVVLDSFALPVEGARRGGACVRKQLALTRAPRRAGTETRVNAGNEANEYMVEVVEMAKSIGRPARSHAQHAWQHALPCVCTTLAA